MAETKNPMWRRGYGKSLLLSALYLLLLCSKVLAGDYQVAYAIDVHGVREAGKYVECVYRSLCSLTFEKSSIRITIGSNGGRRSHFVVVNIYDGTSCCFFYDGGSTITIDGDTPYHQLAIFEGKKRLGDELVFNKKVGNIFLGFTEFR